MSKESTGKEMILPTSKTFPDLGNYFSQRRRSWINPQIKQIARWLKSVAFVETSHLVCTSL